MRLRYLLSEALRDVVSGTARTLTFSSALTCVLLACGVADSVGVAQQLRAGYTFHTGGAATITMTAPGAIDGAACDALSFLPGVEAAGALRGGATSVVLTLLPGTPVPSFEVSPTFAQVVHAKAVPGANGNGVYVSTEVLAALGRGNDVGELATASGPLPLSRTYTYPSDGRRAGFSWAVLSPVLARGAFDECWVTTWPQLEGTYQLLFNTLDVDRAASIDIGAVQVSQLNGRLGATFGGNAGYRTRTTRFGPAIAALAGVLLALWITRTRRVELAARLHDGVSRPDLITTMLFECLAGALPAGTAVAWSGAWIAGGTPYPGRVMIVWNALAVGAGGVVGAVVGVLAGTGLVREEMLFKFFKDR